MFVSCFRKFAVVYLILGCCVSGAFAQKNSTKLVKSVIKKPVVRVAETVRPPLKMAEPLPSLSSVLQQHLLFTLDLAAQRQAAQKELAAATAARKRALATQSLLKAPVEDLQLNTEDLAYVAKQTAALRHYLDTHDNTWPTYVADGSNYVLLRTIRNFMEVESPSAPVLAVQREIIRMRAHSRAYHPQYLLSIVNDMMAYDIVPSRAYMGVATAATEEELAIGEDIAFAVAAYKVPMKDNPWQIDGMAEMADKVTTYNAMRRVEPLFEGLPVTYEKDGFRQMNFPIWTRAEYAQQQLWFAQEYPFEYALAPYREKEFGGMLPHIYNTLSDVEKKAILFHAPGIETNTDAQISADWYDEAGLKWDREHTDRELRSFLSSEDEADFMKRLSGVILGNYKMFFRNSYGERVLFKELPYEDQVEFLRWAWQMHRLTPQTVLNALYK